MHLIFTERTLQPEELKLLNRLKARYEKQSISAKKPIYYLIAILIGLVSTIIVVNIPDSFWTFLLGTTAVFSIAFLIFVPYEAHKLKKRKQLHLEDLNAFIKSGKVSTCHIASDKIAFAGEYEDEGDLYLIELKSDWLLYVWDVDHKLRSIFPRSEFEIYEDKFYQIVGKVIIPLGKQIEAININPKAKWEYFKRNGWKSHLELENISFDGKIKQINALF